MRLLLLIYFYFTASFVYSFNGYSGLYYSLNNFNELNEYYEKQGIWIERKKNKISLGSFFINKKNGLWVYFDDENRLLEMRFYKSDNLLSVLSFSEDNYFKFSKTDISFIRNNLDIGGFMKPDVDKLTNKDFFNLLPDDSTISMGYNVNKGLSFYIDSDMRKGVTTVSLKISNNYSDVIVNFSKLNDEKQLYLEEIFKVNKDKFINGTRFIYDTSNNQPIIILEYVNGMLNGKCLIWSYKRQDYVRFNLVNGKIQSLLKKSEKQIIYKYFFLYKKYVFTKKELYSPWCTSYEYLFCWLYSSGLTKGFRGTDATEKTFRKAVLKQGYWIDIYSNVVPPKHKQYSF